MVSSKQIRIWPKQEFDFGEEEIDSCHQLLLH